MKVLVVDDSAVVREGLATLLGAEPGVEVSTASDPLIAMQKMKVSRPDVILLDLQLPRMDGLSFLRRLGEAPERIPVVVCSALSGGNGELALEALEAGAVEVVAKPALGIREFLEESRVTLLEALRGAVSARRPTLRARVEAPARVVPRVAGSGARLIAIGCSTGGPQALKQLLAELPEDSPGVVIVQHMPKGYTAALARTLDAVGRLRVVEARGGEAILPGTALLAPGDRHLRVVRSGAGLAVDVSDGPLVSRHRPSVDVLFHSVALAVGPAAVALLLTGMGSDGAQGMAALQRAGATCLAQDEESSVVFGMAKEAIALGAVDEVHPLSRLAAAALLAAQRRAAK